MSSSQQKTLEDFISLQHRNALSHAIRAAVELGVINALRNGQRTAAQLADELGAHPEALTRLLDAVAETELVEKYGDDYALSSIARLIPDRFYDFGDEYWKHLVLHTKTGAPLPVCDEVPVEDIDYIANKTSEEWTLTPTAMIATQALDIGKSRKDLRILEIGCGSAIFSATLTHSDPGAKITLLDRPIGIQRARKTIESVGAEHDVNYVEAENILDLDSIQEIQNDSFDLVLIAGQIHRMTLGSCQRLFSQVHKLVKPDREFAIVDVFPGQESGDKNLAIFNLELGLRSSQGRLHDPLALESELRSSGFEQVQFAHLPATPYYWGLILAQRA